MVQEHLEDFNSFLNSSAKTLLGIITFGLCMSAGAQNQADSPADTIELVDGSVISGQLLGALPLRLSLNPTPLESSLSLQKTWSGLSPTNPSCLSSQMIG